MPFSNGKPYNWINVTPIVDSPFVEKWIFGEPLPPPESEFIITEDSLFFTASESGDNLITEF